MDPRPELIRAIIRMESGGRADPPDAGAGAQGLMQIEPATASAYGFDPTRLRNADYNLKAGTGIVGALLDKHKGNEREALKSYYGRGKAKPGFPTTDEYADRVLAMAGPSAVPIPGDATVEPEGAMPIPEGASVESDPAGSVFESTPQRLKRYARTVVPAAVGTALPVAAGAVAGALVGPEATAPVAAGVRIAGQAIGGAVAPYAQYSVSSLMGDQSATAPTWKDALQSTLINGAFAGLGEGGAAATKWADTEDAVRAELAKLPKSEQTLANVKQIRAKLAERATEAGKVSAQDLRNRDFWKAHGATDEQIDQALNATPDVQQELARTIQAGNRLKGAFQTMREDTSRRFHERYTPLLPDKPVDTKDVGQQMIGLAQNVENPGFKKWLTAEGTSLSASEDPLQGIIPADELATMSPRQRQNYINALPKKGQSLAGGLVTQQGDYRAPSTAVPGPEAGVTRTPDQIQGLRTDLARQLPRTASNSDLAARSKLHQLFTDTIHGAQTPEQRGAFDALDAEYGRFRDVLDKLDPRDEHYGPNTADALFDPAVNSRGAALTMIDMAQKADAVKPGVMADLRGAFLDKALQQARVPGQPMEELKTLRTLQEQWGGDTSARAVMGAMFGKGSPLANPAQFTRVVEASADSEPLKLAAKKPTVVRTILSSPYFQGAIAYNALALAVGGKGGSPIMALFRPNDLESFAGALIGMSVGSVGIGLVIRSGNNALSRSMVRFINNPNSATAVRYTMDFLGSGIGAAAQSSTSLPTEEQIRAAE